MKIPFSIGAYLTRTYIAYAIVGAVLIALSVYAVSGSREPKLNTERVLAGAFEQTISVAGKVVPSREVDLGFTGGGKIVAVHGSVGTAVSAGSVLASIDSSDIRASIMQREAALENQRARLASVRQGARPEEIALAQAAVDNAEIALTQANSTVIDAIRDAYVKADDAIRVKLYQFITNPRTYNPQVNFQSSDSQGVIELQNSVIKIESTLSEWQRGNAALSENSDIDAAIADAQARIAAVSSLLSRASGIISTGIPNATVSSAALSGYALDIAGARASVSGANAALSSAVAARKNAIAALDNARKSLVLKKAGPVQADIDAQAAQVRAAEADLANARALLTKTAITAPFSGVITKMDAKVGLIAGPNTPLVTMISSGTYQIESYVPEINIGLIAVNNPAVVTLDAYGDEVLFDARVVSIDPAATLRDGVPSYRAVLQFTGFDNRIKSGMTANVVITTSKKENVLTVPQGVVVERDGKKYVRVLDGTLVVEREIATGAVSSLGRIEVLSGLQPGDTIVLSGGEQP